MIKKIIFIFCLFIGVAVAAQSANAKNLLIISSPEILSSSAIDDYRAAREIQGWTFFFKNTGDIGSQYDGRDLQEKTRNCVKEFYAKYNPLSVIVLGDETILPYRMTKNTSASSISCRSDYYYACLGEGWDDANKNGIFGELEDKPDLDPDVSFGRFLVSTAQQAKEDLAMSLVFGQNAPADLELWGCLENNMGQEMVDRTTKLLSFWKGSISTILTPSYRLLAIRRMNESAWNIGHLDTGSAVNIRTGGDYINAADISALVKGKPFLFYSTACNVGSANLIKSFNGKAAAVIANTSYGLHPQDQELMSEFFKFWLTEDLTLGQALNKAKKALLFGASPAMKQVFKQINLFGDPTMWYEQRNVILGDFDRDGDVDGSDLAVFAADFGRTNCDSSPECEGDFNHDNDVDGSDLAVFASNFGRTKPH